MPEHHGHTFIHTLIFLCVRKLENLERTGMNKDDKKKIHLSSGYEPYSINFVINYSVHIYFTNTINYSNLPSSSVTAGGCRGSEA